MHHLPLVADKSTLTPAPLAEVERASVVRALLAPLGLHPRRLAYAASTGLTITYVHVHPGDGAVTATHLAALLPWADTSLSLVSNALVAISTERG